MKSFPLMQGKNLAGLGVTLTPALAFASEAAFNPLEWDGLFATLEYTAVLNLDKHIEITVDWENGTSEVYLGLS